MRAVCEHLDAAILLPPAFTPGGAGCSRRRTYQASHLRLTLIVAVRCRRRTEE